MDKHFGRGGWGRLLPLFPSWKSSKIRGCRQIGARPGPAQEDWHYRRQSIPQGGNWTKLTVLMPWPFFTKFLEFPLNFSGPSKSESIMINSSLLAFGDIWSDVFGDEINYWILLKKATDHYKVSFLGKILAHWSKDKRGARKSLMLYDSLAFNSFSYSSLERTRFLEIPTMTKKKWRRNLTYSPGNPFVLPRSWSCSFGFRLGWQ